MDCWFHSELDLSPASGGHLLGSPAGLLGPKLKMDHELIQHDPWSDDV